jgi:hypothetical protein
MIRTAINTRTIVLPLALATTALLVAALGSLPAATGETPVVQVALSIALWFALPKGAMMLLGALRRGQAA